MKAPIAIKKRGRPKGATGRQRPLKAPKATLIEALEAKIERMPNGCWIYQGTPTQTGHSALYCAGHVQGSAHRVAYAVWVGPIPPKKCVLQSCNDKQCVNPAHLYLGAFDAVARQRRNYSGGGNPMSKLTPLKVDEIRRRVADGERPGEIAKHYQVSVSTISQIKNNNTWRVEPDSAEA